MSLNSSFDGNTLGYSRIPSNQYFNSASPNRYNFPIGFNRGDSAYNRTDWNLGVSVGNNRGNWGISDTNGYGRNSGTGSGLSSLSFSGNNTNGFDGSIEELYRGSSVYRDSTRQQQMSHQSSDELDGWSRSYGFGIDNVVSDPSGNVSESYPGSYSVGNRQTVRGIEA